LARPRSLLRIRSRLSRAAQVHERGCYSEEITGFFRLLTVRLLRSSRVDDAGNMGKLREWTARLPLALETFCQSWLTVVRLIAFAVAVRGVAAAAPNDITLRFAVFDHPEALDTLRQVLREFELANPGVKVNLENSDYNTYFHQLFAQYAAGVAPDVAMLDIPNIDRFAKRGILRPLNSFFCDVRGFDINAYYPEIVHACSYEGQLYVLPRDIAPQGLIYYNKRAFDDARIPYPDGTWTWDFQERPALREKDFLWVMHRLTKTDANGKVVRYGFLPDNEGLLTDTLVYSQGLSYIDDIDHVSELRFTDPRVIKTYGLVSDLIGKYGYVASSAEVAAYLSNPQEVFADGRAAMYQNGIWEVKYIRDYMKQHPDQAFDWDITLAPGFKTGQQAWPSGGSGYAMLSSTAHQREAWRLIAWMAGRPGMIAMAKSGISQPAIKSLARSEPWIPGPHTPPDERVPASRILTDVAVSHSVFGVRDENWNDIKNLTYDHNDNIFAGHLSPQGGMQANQDEGIHRLRDILREQNAPLFNWWAGGLLAAAIMCGLIGWVFMPPRGLVESNRQKRENRVAYRLLSPWFVGLILFSIGPMLFSLLMGMSSWDTVAPARWRGAGNFTEMFTQDPKFWPAMTLTVGYALCSVPITIGLALLLALLLNRNFRGTRLMRTCFVLPVIASPVALTLIWRKLLEADGGVVNALIYGPDGHRNLFGLGSFAAMLSGSTKPADWIGNDGLVVSAFTMMALLSAGTAMVILQAGLQSIPSDFKDVATIEGARPWQKLRFLTLPMLAPYLLFLCLSGFVGGFQLFSQPFIVASVVPGSATRFFQYYVYNTTFTNFRVGYGAALTWLLFLITFTFSLLQLRVNRSIYYEADHR